MRTPLPRCSRTAALLLGVGITAVTTVWALAGWSPLGDRPSTPPTVDVLRVRVLDDLTGRPLGNSYFEPGFALLDEARPTADPEGWIQVPRAMLAALHESDPDHRGALVSERDHQSLPAWSIPDERGSTAWWAWDRADSVVIRLEPLAPTMRLMRVRLLDDAGGPRTRCIVYVRGPAVGSLCGIPNSARADANGIVELPAPPAAALEIWDGRCRLGEYVIARGEVNAAPREIRVPTPVAVRVRVPGIPGVPGVPDSAPLAFLEYGDLIPLDPDDRLGFAKIDGVDASPLRAFCGRRTLRVPFRDTGLHEISFLVPRGVPLTLSVDPDDIDWRDWPMRADEALTLEVPWAQFVKRGLLRGVRSVDVRWSPTPDGLGGR